MNRNYCQDQEIDCSCFELHKKKPSLIGYHSNTINLKINMKKKSCKLNSSFNLTNPNKLQIKKSLKKKMDTNDIKYEKQCIQNSKKHVATQTMIQNSSKQNVKLSQINNKENRIIQLQQQLVNLSYFKHQQNNSKSLTKIKNQIMLPSSYHNIKIIQCPSIKITNQMSVQQINKSFKKKHVTYDIKQNQQNKAIKFLDPSDVQSQSKTVKKKPILTQIKFSDLNPSLTSKFLQDKTQKQLQTSDNWKKISIKAQGILKSSKKLKSMYPKEIQSFGQESISGFQSEVIERGRFTWAPDSSDKSKQKGEIPHTFHFRQTSSFSNVTDYQGSRISNQEIRSIHN